jgi:putative ABC transport system substrate-binding protein
MSSRREFITRLGGAAAAWPIAARAQQPERLRLVGVLMGSADNAEIRSRMAVFLQALRELGWIEDRNVRIDLRWAGTPQSIATRAQELVQLQPDVIFAGPTNALIPLQKATRTIPIVFVTVSDPLGQGFVESLARPTGNITVSATWNSR